MAPPFAVEHYPRGFTANPTFDLSRPSQDTAGAIAFITIASAIFLFILVTYIHQKCRRGTRRAPCGFSAWLSRGWDKLRGRGRTAASRRDPEHAVPYGGRSSRRRRPDGHARHQAQEHEMTYTTSTPRPGHARQQWEHQATMRAAQMHAAYMPFTPFLDAGPAHASSMYSEIPRYEDLLSEEAPQLPPPAYGSWVRPLPHCALAPPGASFSTASSSSSYGHNGGTWQWWRSNYRRPEVVLPIPNSHYSAMALASGLPPSSQSATRLSLVDSDDRWRQWRARHTERARRRDAERVAAYRRRLLGAAADGENDRYRAAAIMFY
ncbi:hypothetical protein JDV02_003167 [Purpureocillium takamizusanense]|uniref:Uncharacterized protein n=1 Tax=Purpureocillium takamizusanense TaxID=2060973 RepID=A0A9Q8V9E0_9HYPO|nr:uncharacterized protein JDV02_003167 [Purpureocillium takamizusanense]UNI16759.1 hypothetical protein JDV02_003167 [Purpureocillium takamizusanense]